MTDYYGLFLYLLLIGALLGAEIYRVLFNRKDRRRHD